MSPVAAADISVEFAYCLEQRKLQRLQEQFRTWLETKEDIVRLADERDQLLALLYAKYGEGEGELDAGDAVAEVPLQASGRY